MFKRQIGLAAVFAALVFWLGIPPGVQAQDDYMFLSKKGAKWEFQVTIDSKDAGTLAVLNEGNTTGTGNSTTFSWTFKNPAGAITIRMEFYYDRSSDGVLLSGTNVYNGSRLASSERYDPPILALKLPLKDGEWEYKGFKVSDKGREAYAVTNRVRSVQITVPSGTFDAFEIQGQESTGSKSTEYWAKNVGLIKMVQVQASDKTMTAELAHYSLSGEAPQVVARASSSRFKKDPDGAPQDNLSGTARFNMQMYRSQGGGKVDLCARNEPDVAVAVDKKVDLSKKDAVKAVLEEAKEYALVQCESIANKGKSIIVMVYQSPFSDKHDKGGNAAWVAYFKYVSEDKYAYREDNVGHFNKEEVKSSKKVVERKTKEDDGYKIKIDDKTGAKLSISHSDYYGKCDLGGDSMNARVRIDVTSSTNLSDQSILKSLVEAGMNYVVSECKDSRYNIKIEIRQSGSAVMEIIHLGYMARRTWEGFDPTKIDCKIPELDERFCKKAKAQAKVAAQKQEETRQDQRIAEQTAERDKEKRRDEAIVKGAKVSLHQNSWACLTAELVPEAYSLEQKAAGGLGRHFANDKQAFDKLQSIVEEGQCIKAEGFKGIVVARSGKTAQVKGNLSLMMSMRENVTIWLPTWSLITCKGLQCD